MKEKKIKSFEAFVDYTESYKNKYLFRGQANKDWNISPSIFRNKIDLENEAKSLNNAIKNSGDNILTTLFKLQHYGNPTRLLDLTISPLSALFFTIDDLTQVNNDGVIYVIDKSKSYSLESEEINLFSEFLIKENINNLDIISGFSEDEAIKVLTRDYIIEYGYNFSYTNQRAILQGGTALIFGFEIFEDKLVRKSTRNIDHLIYERIIIPAKLKRDITNELERLGYSRDILYETFEYDTYNDIELTEDEFNVCNNNEFYKVVAVYKLNDLIFDRDDLIFKIKEIYKKLFRTYGYNARIWLYFYYDANDVANDNYICRTQWDKIFKYKIIWTKDYYTDRLRYMNEEISTDELKSKFTPKIQKAMKINKRIENIVSTDTYNVEYLINTILENRSTIRKIFLEISDIGKGNLEVEKYARAAEIYIGDVYNLVNEIIFYKNRGENEQFLRYWTEIRLKDCRKSLSKLEENPFFCFV